VEQGEKAGLRNITACPPLSIQGAFGPPIRGELDPMKLETVVIDGMGDNTIISVSQVCKLGYIAVFNDKQFKVSSYSTISMSLPDYVSAINVHLHTSKSRWPQRH
jgi:hypothetical protein